MIRALPLVLLAAFASGSIHLVTVEAPPEPALVVSVDTHGALRLVEREADGSETLLLETRRDSSRGAFSGIAEGAARFSGTKSVLEVDLADDVPWVWGKRFLPPLLRDTGIEEVHVLRPNADPVVLPARIDWGSGRWGRNGELVVRLSRGGATRVTVTSQSRQTLLAMPLSNSPDAVPGQDPFEELGRLFEATGGPIVVTVGDTVPVQDAATVLEFLIAKVPNRIRVVARGS